MDLILNVCMYKGASDFFSLSKIQISALTFKLNSLQLSICKMHEAEAEEMQIDCLTVTQ